MRKRWVIIAITVLIVISALDVTFEHKLLEGAD
jgi:hypothetical protein